jgi:hypothetical protein
MNLAMNPAILNQLMMMQTAGTVPIQPAAVQQPDPASQQAFLQQAFGNSIQLAGAPVPQDIGNAMNFFGPDNGLDGLGGLLNYTIPRQGRVNYTLDAGTKRNQSVFGTNQDDFVNITGDGTGVGAGVMLRFDSFGGNDIGLVQNLNNAKVTFVGSSTLLDQGSNKLVIDANTVKDSVINFSGGIQGVGDQSDTDKVVVRGGNFQPVQKINQFTIYYDAVNNNTLVVNDIKEGNIKFQPSNPFFPTW